MNKIKKIFKNIMNWIKETPSIQPLLVIALIFAIMFSLTFTPKVVSTVQGWFSTSGPKPKEVEFDEAVELFDDKIDNNFLFLYASGSCSVCQSYTSKTISRYLKSKDHLPVYYIDIDKAIEDEVDENKLAAFREKMRNQFDVDYSNVTSDNFDYPTTFLVIDGKTQRSYTGYMDYAKILEFVDKDEKFSISAPISNKYQFI